MRFSWGCRASKQRPRRPVPLLRSVRSYRRVGAGLGRFALLTPANAPPSSIEVRRHFGQSPREAAWGSGLPHFEQTEDRSGSGINVICPFKLRSGSGETVRAFSRQDRSANRPATPANDAAQLPPPPACSRCPPPPQPTTRQNARAADEWPRSPPPPSCPTEPLRR